MAILLTLANQMNNVLKASKKLEAFFVALFLLTCYLICNMLIIK